MVLEVYCDPCTVNSHKVLGGLDMMGTKYELKMVDYFQSAQKSDEYKKINPMCTVPSAKDGDLTIIESNAILQYAADHSGNDSFYPKDPKKRAEVNMLLLWESSNWFASCYVYLVENVVKPLLKSEPDQSVMDKESTKWNTLAGFLDARLANSKFLVGDHVTIADIAVMAPMHLHEACKFPLEQHPNLKRWALVMDEIPEWKKTQGSAFGGPDKLVGK